MTSLRNLFDEARELPAGDQATYISSKLPEALSDGPLHYWRLSGSVTTTAQRTLIGVAPYSLPDLKLLDALKESLSKNTHLGERIDVLDVLRCAAEDFEQCIPGIGRVFQTPVVGIWENGVLTQHASGAKACRLVISRYNLSLTKGQR